MRRRLLLLGLLLAGVVRTADAHPADRYVCRQPLGALYSTRATVFRVWAPTAGFVRLNLYRTPVGGRGRTLPMLRAADGSWSARVPGDCIGRYYTYTTSFHPDREVIDPYAEAVTSWDGRGIVVHDTTPLVPRPQFPPQDAVVCELHVRDFTIDPGSGNHHPGTYLGLVEGGTHLPGDPAVHTGLSDLEELGVNTVQLMPILEFSNDKRHHQYGWGYDAAFYNTPDGNYATHPLDGSRVHEVKTMINEFHRHGMRVVLDVVFTHTAQNVYDRAVSFEGLVPGYYFRHRPDGTLWNGSGCGNEFRTEAPMARRFMLDSVRHWVVEYGVDGFRFDLMGLADRETMRQIAREVHHIDPNLLVYGEPWTAGPSPVDGMGRGKQAGTGIAIFNDHFRDALRGDVFHPDAKGFLEGADQTSMVRQGIMGSIDDFAATPLESINYIECHDNHTLWDRLALAAKGQPEATREAMDRLGAAILLTSQGIPFLQSGQAFLRSKDGEDNSYNKGDAVNAVRWSEKPRHMDTFRWYQSLISLRRQHPMFRLSTAAQVRAAVHWLQSPPGTIAYTLTDPTGRDSWRQAVLFFNARPQAWTPDVPLSGPTRRLGCEADGPVQVAPWSAVVVGEPR